MDDQSEHAEASSLGQKTPEERKAMLARAVTSELAHGKWRVESQGDFNAVLAKGKKVSHGLHLFLTIITAGIWGLVWIGVAMANREQRMTLFVDEYGNVQRG